MSTDPEPSAPAPEPAAGAGGGAPPPPKASADTPPTPGPDAAASAPTRGSSHKSWDDPAADYARGRETLRPLGDSIHVSGGHSQEVHIGDRIVVQAARSPVSEPGPVPTDVLDKLRKRYVEVPGYQQLLDDLRARRLLVLVGHQGSGRTTTALHLLGALVDAGLTDDVCRIDHGTDVRGINDAHVGKSRGSLGELTTSSAAPTQAHAEQLAGLLARHGSFCVLVAPPTYSVLQAFVDFRAECASPPFEALLDTYLGIHLCAGDPPGTGAALLALAKSEMGRAVGRSPSPRAAEVEELVLLLLDHLRGDLTLDAVRARVGGFLERRVSRWFADLGETTRRDGTERRLRLAALRVALAVFDGLPWHIVVATSATLGERLVTPVTPGSSRPTAGRPLTAEPDATLIAGLEAELVDEDITFGGVAVPSQTVRHTDRRIPAVLLTHVWRRHQQLRTPLAEWLAELGRHPQPVIRIRAAQATGLLAAADFSHTFPALIEPAAAARPARRRRVDFEHDAAESDEFDTDDQVWELRRTFAAMALDQAALDPRVSPVVEAVLRRWRRSSDHALRWTAARTLGYQLGDRALERSLDELRIIGTPWELVDFDDVPAPERPQVWDLRWVAGHGVARLFANGHRHEILALLCSWLSHRRRSVKELAQQAVVTMAELRMSTVRTWDDSDGDFPTGPAARDRWPILLGLTDDDPTLVQPVADILGTVLDSGPSAEVLMEVIGTWWDMAESTPELLDAFCRLVPALTRTERGRRRLEYALDRHCRRWADPLPRAVADRIKTAASAR